MYGGHPVQFEYANWRWFKKYGGGSLSDLGSHQIDVFNMMLGVPPRVISEHRNGSLCW